jgi:hypothetical protein
MQHRRLVPVVSGALIAGSIAIASSGSTSADPSSPSFVELGSYDTGAATGDETAAEIVAYEDDTMYVLSVGQIDIVDIADPARPEKIGEILLPGDPTSVAVDDGLVAVSLPGVPRTAPGTVLFFRGTEPIGEATVGALPDMVTFTPDGKTLVVANEGEPNSYDQPDSVDPEGSVSLISTNQFRNRAVPKVVERPRTISFAEFNVGGRRHNELPADVRISGPNATVAQDLEPEYITVAADSRTAWVSLQENNAIAVLDLRRKTVERIFALGTSDHSRVGFGIDASNRDDAINIANWPVQGLYMPDGIANYEVGGRQYVVTANEGDAREYDGFEDIGRAEDVADTTLIPAAGESAELGRLNVITSAPAPTNAAGQVTELFSFGSRSFTIRTADGDIVWDSGDDFEQITAQAFPDNFNASNSNNDFDNRSDDKGPEPENVVVGELDGRQYAFVALERIGGVMVYDVTDPSTPEFEQYLTTRVFPEDSDDVGPDSGPEGLVFVPAAESPTGSALLIVGNEVTGTVNIFG